MLQRQGRERYHSCPLPKSREGTTLLLLPSGAAPLIRATRVTAVWCKFLQKLGPTRLPRQGRGGGAAAGRLSRKCLRHLVWRRGCWTRVWKVGWKENNGRCTVSAPPHTAHPSARKDSIEVVGRERIIPAHLLFWSSVV